MIDDSIQARWGCAADIRGIAASFKHEIPKGVADSITDWLFDNVFISLEYKLLHANELALSDDQILGMIQKTAQRGNLQAQKLLADMRGLTNKNEQREFARFTSGDYIAAGKQAVRLIRTALKDRRLCPVCRRPTVVSEEARLHPAPDSGDDNQVATLAVPDRPSGDSPGVQ